MARKRRLLAPLENPTDLFAPGHYASVLAPVRSIPLLGTKQELRRRVRCECFDGPGVYGMLDADQQLIYVGMSRLLKRRLLSYFASRSGGKKEFRIGRRAKSLLWQPAAHELIAWLRERELIRTFRPAYNVQGHPTRMQLGYIVQFDDPAPAFSLERQIPRSHIGVWGPVPLTQYVKQAVEKLNHHFQLRDCARSTPMRFRGDPALFEGVEATPCLRADLGSCLAPCIAACTRRGYSSSVRAAKQFLDGSPDECFLKLKTEMRTAAQTQRYERAAKARDTLQALQRLDHHLRRFHDWSSQANFVYPIESRLDNQTWWLLCLRGNVIAAVPAPTDRESRRAVNLQLSAALRTLAGSSPQRSVTSAHEFDSARTLYRWFHRNPEERPRRLTLREAKKS
ncbi:UvrB/UvrC motif-containing protein [Planctomicrobium piriforme]|uniref:Excinuclease ABC subunit C n=1 Tax=Planctomicrobium piriforme TaxID=1576369 RepID=A0A1I3KTW3_9PLAN|nr:UvrB/UvrC motif-containing protein [Planctomicrobium piriforme]SFI75959.1 excinuclease ABC subunit C [Planctomicrobium piriforme]